VRRLARPLALAAALGLGWYLLGARPRELTLVYDVSAVPDATALEVDLRAGPTVVRHARIQVHRGEQVRHPVRLKEGGYELAWRVERPSGVVAGGRHLEVEGDQTIVLPLGR
jgi:hypothetical protein